MGRLCGLGMYARILVLITSFNINNIGQYIM